MYPLLFGIGGLALFQIFILYIAWRHKDSELFVFPKPNRASVAVHVIKALNELHAIQVFTYTLLNDDYGKISIAQMEFVHQIHKACTEAIDSLKEIGIEEHKNTVSPGLASIRTVDEGGGTNPTLSVLEKYINDEKMQKIMKELQSELPT